MKKGRVRICKKGQQRRLTIAKVGNAAEQAQRGEPAKGRRSGSRHLAPEAVSGCCELSRRRPRRLPQVASSPHAHRWRRASARAGARARVTLPLRPSRSLAPLLSPSAPLLSGLVSLALPRSRPRTSGPKAASRTRAARAPLPSAKRPPPLALSFSPAHSARETQARAFSRNWRARRLRPDRVLAPGGLR